MNNSLTDPRKIKTATDLHKYQFANTPTKLYHNPEGEGFMDFLTKVNDTIEGGKKLAGMFGMPLVTGLM